MKSPFLPIFPSFVVGSLFSYRIPVLRLWNQSHLLARSPLSYLKLGLRRRFSRSMNEEYVLESYISQHDGLQFLKKRESYRILVNHVVNRYESQCSMVENVVSAPAKEAKDAPKQDARVERDDKTNSDSTIHWCTSGEVDVSRKDWKLELAWLTKALEPALNLCRRALPIGSAVGDKPPPSSRSLVEIVSSIQHSKLGLHDWSLSDLTIGLYLIYLQQASTNPFEDIQGMQMFSESLVQHLIYHLELAKGAYRDSAAGLAKNSMLRESNIVKFVKNSSVLRPGYYIGIDNRNKLVILGIRGTHTVYDLITDIVSSTDEEVTFEGYSTHFGTAEAARWFMRHELGTVKKYLDRHEGYRLRLVGHSLGGATASLLAIMLHKKSSKELGFDPDIVSAVGYGTPPCVSRELAESCSDHVTTVVMQDDIIPRLSIAALSRLRNEVLQTDWTSIFEKEDWRSVVELFANAKQVVTSVQDVAWKLADYAKFRSERKASDVSMRKDSLAQHSASQTSGEAKETAIHVKKEQSTCRIPEELFIPGTVYCLKRNVDHHSKSIDGRLVDYFTLWKRNPGEHFQRITLSNNLISDHKCDSHYFALRDVLKGLPKQHSTNHEC